MCHMGQSRFACILEFSVCLCVCVFVCVCLCLKQHMGSIKCERRREFLENTGSITLALTKSPPQKVSIIQLISEFLTTRCRKGKTAKFPNFFKDFFVPYIADLILYLAPLQEQTGSGKAPQLFGCFNKTGGCSYCHHQHCCTRLC